MVENSGDAQGQVLKRAWPFFAKTAGIKSSSLAPYNGPLGFGASFIRDDSINHGAGKNAFGPTLGGSSCTVKSLRGVTEQGVHVCDSTFVRAEMDSERFDRAGAVPGTGY